MCRLIRDDDKPFLAYSPKISIKDSSEPLQTFLGGILSALKGVHIEPSTFNPDMQLNTIIEDVGPVPGDDIDDNPGAYLGSSGKGGKTNPPITRSRAGRDNAEPGLMVCLFASSYLLRG